MAQQLKVHPALSEERIELLAPTLGHTSCNFSSRGSRVLSGPQEYLHTCSIQIHTHTEDHVIGNVYCTS